MNSFPDRAKSDSPQCDNLPQRKILGIGLSRTGTTSLHLAMGMLGYRSIHCPRLDRLGEILEHYQAAVDTPIACSFRELDLCYPDSLFILTIRDIRSWLESTEWLFTGPPPKSPWKRQLRLKTFGVLTWDRRRFLNAYHRHVEAVLDHFEGRPESLLVLDITAGEGWERLCPFLQTPQPPLPFPHENARLVR